MKKIILTVLILLITVISPLSISAGALDSCEISGLNGCEKFFLETESDNVYAYGIKDNNIVIYNITSKNHCNISVAGKIAHYPVLKNSRVYCVYKDDNFNYNLGIFDVNGTAIKTIILGNSNKYRYSELVVSDNSYFIPTISSFVYASEYNFDGELIYEYKYDYQNVDNIFMNGGEVYVRLSNGEIHSIKDGASVCSTKFYTDISFFNVGDGYVADKNYRIYPLKENIAIDSFSYKTDYLYISGDNVCYSKPNTLYLCDLSGEIERVYNADFWIDSFVVADNKVYIYSEYYSSIIVVDFNEFTPRKSDNNNNKNVRVAKEDFDISYNLDNGIIYDIPLSYTIEDFKKKTNLNVIIYDRDETQVTDGFIRTGYIAEISDKKYPVAVTGDVTGTGVIDSSDVYLLMDSFTGEAELIGAYKKAADYNLDGCVDNKDLLLISREMDWWF